MHCRICGESSFKKISVVKDLRYRTTSKQFVVAECRNCGVCCTLDGTRIISPEKYYPVNYGAFSMSTSEKDIDKTFNRFEKPIFKIFSKRLSWHRLSGVQKSHVPRGTRVLDIGCGTGKYSFHLIRKYRANVTGIEPNIVAATLARKRGVNVHCSTLADFKSNSRFQLVLLIHVLEHLENPVEDLKSIRKLLTPDGFLYVGVPNVHSIERKVFGKYWDGWDIPRHVHHFSPSSLTYTVQKAGFRTIGLLYEAYSIFSRSFNNILFRNIPYKERAERFRWGRVDFFLGLLEALIQSSSAIQLLAINDGTEDID